MIITLKEEKKGGIMEKVTYHIAYAGSVTRHKTRVMDPLRA